MLEWLLKKCCSNGSLCWITYRISDKSLLTPWVLQCTSLVVILSSTLLMKFSSYLPQNYFILQLFEFSFIALIYEFLIFSLVYLPIEPTYKPFPVLLPNSVLFLSWFSRFHLILYARIRYVSRFCDLATSRQLSECFSPIHVWPLFQELLSATSCFFSDEQ